MSTVLLGYGLDRLGTIVILEKIEPAGDGGSDTLQVCLRLRVVCVHTHACRDATRRFKLASWHLLAKYKE